MFDASLVFILLVLLFGSYVQAVAGFALGMIAVALIGGLRLMDIPTLAAVVSFLSMLNSALSLRGHSKEINRRILLWLVLGIVPGLLLGYWLMLYLNESSLWLLELCLGVFITAGGLSMSLQPRSWAQESRAPFTWTMGVVGGVLGGLFSASGPLLGWFAYSQPLSVAIIRATLLSYFLLTTSARTLIVFVDGTLTSTVLTYAALGAPVVVLGAWLGRRFPPVVSEQALKRGVFVLLMVTGAWICFSALNARFDFLGL